MRSRTAEPAAHAVLDLSVLGPEDYVREVLPHSAELWAGARTIDEYVAEFRTLATSGWGRRRFRTVGLRIDGVLVASCKRYARSFRCGTRRFTAAGIGAVFTPPALRGRGYATAMLGALLDAERAAGTDLAYLFSDIRPAFYAALGFVRLPSRAITVRADTLLTERIAIETLDPGDAAIRRVFDALDERRAFGFVRTPLDWEWQRLRATSRESTGAPLVLATRRGRAPAAYVAGRRLPEADAFVLDEFAFARPQDARALAPLLRAAAGDLRKIAAWLPPGPAREELPRGAVRARTTGVAMLLPLSSAFRSAWNAAAREVLRAASDPVWNSDQV